MIMMMMMMMIIIIWQFQSTFNLRANKKIYSQTANNINGHQ